MWGHACLEGRRAPDVNYFDLPPKPAKAPKGASAVEKARAKKALKAWNKLMRPTQGTKLHAIYEAYYLQKVPGAWHPPMVWRDLAAAWHSRPGQIALSGRAHLPDPEDLAKVWCEVEVRLDLSFLPGGAPMVPWSDPRTGEAGASPLLIGGTPDLVTLNRRIYATGTPAGIIPPGLGGRFHLYDYKSTISIDDYAKTPAELLEDEQAAIYSLAVMQEHDLDELECTWIYFQTDETKPPRAMPVHFLMTRAHAEAVVARIAGRALAMAEVQARYLAERPGLLGKRLEVLNSLATNDMACDNFVGCPYHAKRGGPCKPKKSTLGAALNALSAQKKKTTARREASKAAKAAESKSINMAETFKEKQARLKAEREAAASGGGASEVPAKETVEASGEEAPAEKPAPAPSKPKAPTPKADEPTASLVVACSYGSYTLELPAKSPLYKAIVKACKAQQAADAAIMGE